MGWVLQRHGAFYAAEYGYNSEFEALVARIIADFMRKFDPKRERCWIAEIDGENAGCVLVAKRSRTIAQLRLLIVDPIARGKGVGARLVDACIRFARKAGYRKLILWTSDELLSARKLYAAAGFTLIREETGPQFGKRRTMQFWSLQLSASGKPHSAPPLSR
jgi:N-acetylglutamate synthase-like GNAT family acetyltransferase